MLTKDSRLPTVQDRHELVLQAQVIIPDLKTGAFAGYHK
jgi:hypothetical protein